MAEPTASKWQVMYDICKSLLPLLEPASGVLAPASQLCRLVAMCQQLSCGTTNDERDKRVVHPHTEK